MSLYSLRCCLPDAVEAEHTRTLVTTPVETTSTPKAAVAQTKGVTVTQVAAVNGQCPTGSSSCVPPATATTPPDVAVECGGNTTAWGPGACAYSTEVFAALKAKYQDRSWTPATVNVITRSSRGARIPSLCKPGPDIGVGKKIGPTWAKHGTWVCRA